VAVRKRERERFANVGRAALGRPAQPRE